MVYQEIRGSEVQNFTRAGIALSGFACSDEALTHLGGSGFMDGGCYALAITVNKLLTQFQIPSELMIVGRNGIIDHVVVKVQFDGDDIYLDGDGLASESELLNKLVRLESLSGVTIRSFNQEDIVPAEMCSYESEKINKFLDLLHQTQFLDGIMAFRTCSSRLL